MSAQYDLDRALGAWFLADAAPTPPAEPLVHVLETSRQRRPRPLLVAGIGSAWVGSQSDGPASEAAAHARSLVRLALIAALVTTLLGAAVLVGSRLLVPRPVPHRYLDQLVSAPDLSVPMYGPTLVALADGRVLIVDNSGGQDGTQRALVYDPASGSTTPVGSAESYVGAGVRLQDGRVLLIEPTASQIFDPDSMQFAPVGPMQTSPRWGAAAALLHDGRVLVTGGAAESGSDVGTTSAELFDPATLTFTATGSMAVPRQGHSLATLPDGRVFVTPGASRMVELFDPASGTFRAGAGTDAATGRAIALPDGRVVIIGGGGIGSTSTVWFWIWDPSRDLFVIATTHPERVMDAELLDDGRIFLIGLCNGRPGGWTGVYEPGGAVVPMQPTRACRPTSTRLDDGRVVIVGGVEPALPFVQIFQ
jgi:hypothetical protein